MLFLSNPSKKYYFADLFFNKKSGLFKRFNKRQFTLLAPQIISSYITQQLNKNAKLKQNSFKNNLKNGITLFCFQLLRLLQVHIVGFKIVCSGKWKKTRSGRKQRLTVKFGRIRKSSISNKILYSYSTQKTKYGACGIKV
jgi:ribosomal protein S3